MPIYEYETIPAQGKRAQRYEIRQSMNDVPLEKHPETGEAIRRVYAAFSVGGSAAGAPTHEHTPTCGCGNAHACGLN